MSEDGFDEDEFDEDAVAAAWERQAGLWSDSVRAGHDLFRELYIMPAFLDFMPPIEGRAAIDLGCGEGTNTRRFAAAGGRMTAIDISQAMIDRARAAERRDPQGIRYECCSFCDIAFAAPDSFDVALSTMALMDGPDFSAAAREAYRVLAPGGWLCFSILHPCFFTRIFDWLQADDGSYEGIRAGRYFDTTPFVERWKFGRHPDTKDLPFFEIPRFPRTLADYINPLCDTGFRIAGIEEPRPAAKASENRAWLQRFRDHAPLVLFIAATKS